MLAEQLAPGGIRDARVLTVMEKIPRHLFVPKGLEDQAYLDRPLYIGNGQTISQPLMVGLMTQALELKGHEKVLEIGTGSGYQAVILAELAKKVFTVERIASLSLNARKIIYRLGYNNISFKIGDGTLGWEEEAPFDKILVTAGGPRVPESLKRQLVDEGKMIAPIGMAENQRLILIKREGKRWTEKVISECRFVKLVGKEGWESE